DWRFRRNQGLAMKITFRVTLLTLLLSLSIFLIGVLGLSAYWYGHKSAQQLANQILDQLSQRIGEFSRHQVESAEAEVALIRKSLESGRFQADNFPTLVRPLQEILELRPGLERINIGTPDGQWLSLHRGHEGRLGIGESRRNSSTGQLELHYYWADEYPRQR